MGREPEARAEESELRIYSFIVKIWIEKPTSPEARSLDKWYGHITEVSGGASKYFSELKDIELFISEKLWQPKR